MTSERLEEIEGLRRQVEELQKELAARPSESTPATGDETATPGLSKREVEELQVKAYRAENAHTIALNEIEGLQRQAKELRKELAESQRRLKSQEKELAYMQQMIGSTELDAPTLFNQFKGKHPKSKVKLKDVEVLIELNPTIVSTKTCSQLPDFYLIRDQVIKEHRAADKLNEHTWTMLNIFIEEVQKGLGDYSHLKGLLDEIERQKLYYQAAAKQKEEAEARYSEAKKRLRLLGDAGW